MVVSTVAGVDAAVTTAGGEVAMIDATDRAIATREVAADGKTVDIATAIAATEIETVVLMRDAECNRGQWPLARVVALHPSRDGLIRGVDVRSRGKTYQQPVTQLCRLEADIS